MEKQRGIFAGDADQARPLGSYSLLTSVYFALFASFLYIARRTDKAFPDRTPWSDLVLLGIATHKLSRLISKDIITSWIRAPFTRYEQPATASEVNEQSRGTGMRRALTELLTFPFCVGQWIASFSAYGLVLAPSFTRLVAAIFTLVAADDFLHYAYEATR